MHALKRQQAGVVRRSRARNADPGRYGADGGRAHRPSGKTPIYRKYITGRKIQLRSTQFAKQTGINPEKTCGSLLSSPTARQGIVLGRGKFANDLEPELERAGMKRSGYKGFTLFGDEKPTRWCSSIPARRRGRDGGAAFADRSTREIARAAAGAGGDLKEMPGESQFWASLCAAGRSTLALPEGNFAANAKKIYGLDRERKFLHRPGAGSDGLATGSCTTDQSAQQVHDALQALIGIGAADDARESTRHGADLTTGCA